MKSACVPDRHRAEPEPPTTSETSAHFTWTDANGNVCDLIGTTGSTVAHYEYMPFGSLAASQGTLACANPWQFSSKYYDAETQLKYYGYRYLENGRWLNREPMGEFASRNLYSFVKNHALYGIDILGLAPIDDYLNSLPDWNPEDLDSYIEDLADAINESNTRHGEIVPNLDFQLPYWNPSGHATVLQGAEFSYYLGIGGGGGSQVLRFDNGYCQRYLYGGGGVGFSLGRNPMKLDPKDSMGFGLALAGDAYDVFDVSDYAGSFITVAGSVLLSGSASIGNDGVTSGTLGLATPGINASLQGFLPVGAPYLCCESGAPPPSGNVECCDK